MSDKITTSRGKQRIAAVGRVWRYCSRQLPLAGDKVLHAVRDDRRTNRLVRSRMLPPVMGWFQIELDFMTGKVRNV
jgi:hypothetical protein